MGRGASCWSVPVPWWIAISAHRCEASEQAVVLLIRAGGEEDGVLFGESYEDDAFDHLDIERSIAFGRVRVSELADQREVRPVGIDSVFGEVSGEQDRAVRARDQRYALVNRAGTRREHFRSGP